MSPEISEKYEFLNNCILDFNESCICTSKYHLDIYHLHNHNNDLNLTDENGTVLTYDQLLDDMILEQYGHGQSPHYWPDIFQTKKIIVMSVLSIGTLLSNVTQLVAIVYHHRKISRMNFFLVHLSIADILTAALTLCPEILWTLTLPFFYGGHIVCKIVKFLQMLGPYLSSFLLCVTSIDRYRAICQPFKEKHTNTLVAFSWLVALFCCVPQIVIFEGTRHNSCYQGELKEIEMCSASWSSWLKYSHYTIMFSVAFFFIPITILLITNCLICKRIWSSGNTNINGSWKSIQNDQNDETETGSIKFPIVKVAYNRNSSKSKLSFHNFRSSSVMISRAKVRSVKLTLIIIALYIVCSAPFVVGQLLSSLELIRRVPELLYWLMTLNSLVNPWVYLIFNRNQFCVGRYRSASSSDTQPPVFSPETRSSFVTERVKKNNDSLH